MLNLDLLINVRAASGGVVDLAIVSIARPRDTGSNLGVERIFSDSVCIGFKIKLFIYKSVGHHSFKYILTNDVGSQ